MDVFWLVFKQRGSWVILGNLSFVSGIGEIHPANTAQLTAADAAAIAMIRKTRPGSTVNKMMSSKLNGQIWPFLRLCSQNDRPRAARPEKHVNNFRWDLFRDAGKITWSGAMNTDRITIPRSNIVMDSLVNFRECPFVTFHARSRKPGRSWIHNVKLSKWRTLGTMRTLARFTNTN